MRRSVATDLLIGTGLAVAAYHLSPYLVGSLAGRVVWTGDGRSRKIALTFDDGPDPRYTPRCLELLAAHGVRASFFLVGERARRHPDLARAIRAGGHDIGNHTWSHRYHWLLAPEAARIEVRRGAEAIGDVIGEMPPFFRPPFGAMNASSYREARRLDERCVMWSLPGRDWQRGLVPETIARRITGRLRGGAIVLLHDGGGAEGAPQVMLEALPRILTAAKQQGFPLVSLSGMLDGTGRGA
jgi:peptidoglycan/xylan/chitin deacetylase (PgdA/CDA1 family)